MLHITLVAALTAVASPALAAGGLKEATRLLERNYSASAAALLRKEPPAADAAAHAFTLGRAYARSAALYRALQRSALATNARHLERLAAQSGRERSRLAAFYHADTLLESGKGAAGTAQLRRFLAEKELPAPYRELAELRLAAESGRLPAGAPRESRARAEYAALASRTPARQAEAAGLVDAALADLRQAGAEPPLRVVSHALGVYARAGQHDKAFALLDATDLSRPSYEETAAASKVLRFYDAALLANLALLHQGAAERLLEQAAADARLKGAAGFFLAETRLAAGRTAPAAAALTALAAVELPVAYRERVAVMQAAADVQTGQAARANAAFAELARRHAADPLLLGEGLAACVAANAACAPLERAAAPLAATGQGERFRGLHAALGHYHAAAGRTERALAYLETARDKSNKNRIDTNDPLLLVRLADLYLANKSFSENLEIYFELSKEFPAVRQLQEAGQGVYSTEYRSAGDVKIF